ncbi:hypothetical protein CRUP_010964, partial [Coryphaenoides rupestris]
VSPSTCGSSSESCFSSRTTTDAASAGSTKRKIEDSAHVARLWGLRKNRPAMNYDKLSRSIRQYYKKGIIRKPDVSQRLVYQFVNPV